MNISRNQDNNNIISLERERVPRIHIYHGFLVLSLKKYSSNNDGCNHLLTSNIYICTVCVLEMCVVQHCLPVFVERVPFYMILSYYFLWCLTTKSSKRLKNVQVTYASPPTLVSPFYNIFTVTLIAYML